MKKLNIILVILISLCLFSCERYLIKRFVRDNSPEEFKNEDAFYLYEKAYDMCFDINSSMREKGSFDIDKALRYIDAAIVLEPNPSFYDFKEDILIYTDKYPQMIEIFKKRATNTICNGGKIASIAFCFDKMGYRDSAIFYYTKALQQRVTQYTTNADLEQKKFETQIIFLIYKDKQKATDYFYSKIDTTGFNKKDKVSEDIKHFINDLEKYDPKQFFYQ